VTPKPVPVTLSEETFTLVVPVFFRVIAWVAVVPSATLPKLTLAGVAEIAPAAPDPERAIVKVGFEASLVTTKLPVAAAAEVGANWT